MSVQFSFFIFVLELNIYMEDTANIFPHLNLLATLSKFGVKLPSSRALRYCKGTEEINKESDAMATTLGGQF
jgi:hypothetical protein